MNNYTLVKTALVNKKQITAYYKGYYREMCPHIIGLKRGKIHGLFYQFGGESSSGAIVNGSPDNWRCIEIEKLEDISLRNGSWHYATLERDQTCIDQVDISIDEIED